MSDRTVPDLAPLDGLIASLRRAIEGSRELDAEIVVALDLRPEWLPAGGELWVDRETPPGMAPTVRFRDGRIKKRSPGNPPAGDYARYTTSVDAALTLAPEGANCHGYELDPKGVEAFISRNCVASGHWISLGHHPTSPAIALCIAALKARKAPA